MATKQSGSAMKKLGELNSSVKPWNLIIPTTCQDYLRRLAKEMIAKAPDGINCDEDLVPGGDLRFKGNSWLRSAFSNSNLSKAPREKQLRVAVKKFMLQKKIGCLTYSEHVAFFPFFVEVASLRVSELRISYSSKEPTCPKKPKKNGSDVK